MQMADHVQPGDLFTADLWNSLVDQVSSLNTRVTALEQGGTGTTTTGQLTITSVQFNNPLHVGDTVTVLGQNFGVPAVTIEDGSTITPVPLQFGSDTQITFFVPPLANLTAPRAFTLRVSNPSAGGNATRQITIGPPAVQLTGTVSVAWVTASPTTVTAGSQEIFQFTATSGVAQSSGTVGPVTFDVAPSLTGITASVDLLDSTQTLVSSKQLSFSQNQTQIFFLRITIPAGTNGTNFQLGATFLNGGVQFGTSGATQFTVGQAVPGTDTSFSLTPLPPGLVTPLGSPGGLINNSIQLRAGTALSVQFDLVFSLVGTYNVTTSFADGASGWTISATPPSFVIASANLGANNQFSLSVTPQANPANGTLVLQVKNQSSTTAQTQRYGLQLLS
jgi:hypothetical protein